MAEEALLVFSTFPEAAIARKIALTLVEENLVACVNLVPQIDSIYRWQGKIESSTEVFAIFKTTQGRYQSLETRLRELHPYEVPEIILIQIHDGLPDYLNWVIESVQDGSCSF